MEASREGPILVAVDVSKLMRSEGFSGGVGVRTGGGGGDVQVRKLEGSTTPSVHRNSSVVRRKDEVCAGNTSGSAVWKNMPETEFHRHAGQRSKHNDEDASENTYFGSTRTNMSLTPGVEAGQSQRNVGKVGRNKTCHTKRSRTVQIDVSVNKTGVEDVKDISTELSNPTRCKNGERTHTPKQRQNSSGKRGDKRIGKVPKSNFSLKNGLVTFGSAAGGNNFLGMYGLKSDALDVTKDLEDLSLNDLLDGSFKCALFGKDKGKKASLSNDGLLLSIRNACSVLRPQKPAQAQNSSSPDSKVSGVLSCVGSSSPSQSAGDKGDTYIGNPPPDQEYSGRFKTAATTSNTPSYLPNDVLERLALTPSKDLDSLLMDAVKPACTRNSSDVRFGKPSSQRNGLPPFPWSHTYSGHCKSGSDAAKLSTSRTACQGRWVRMANTFTPMEGSNGFLEDLQALANNRTQVTLGAQVSKPLQNVAAPICDTSTMSERISSSLVTCSTSEVPPESPRLLVAAETLCKIASHSLKRSTQETTKWLKKPSQKGMRACKLSEKSEKLFIAPKPVVGSNNTARFADGMLPSKKLRLSVDIQKPDRKGPIPWSAQTISSSPVNFFRYSETSFVNKPCMMPPSAKMADKAFTSQRKPRKAVPMEWSEGGSRLE